MHHVSIAQKQGSSMIPRRTTSSRLSHSGVLGSFLGGEFQPLKRPKEPREEDMEVFKRLVERIGEYPDQNKNEVFVFMLNFYQMGQMIKIMEGNHLQLTPAAFHGIFEESNMCLVAFQKAKFIKTYSKVVSPSNSFIAFTLHCYLGNHPLLIEKLEELGTENSILGHFVQDSLDFINLICCPKMTPMRPSIHIITMDALFDSQELEKTFDLCKKENLKFMFSLTVLVNRGIQVSLVFEMEPKKLEYYVVDVSNTIQEEKNFQSEMSNQITAHLSAEQIDFYGFIENRNTGMVYGVFGTDY